MNVDRGSFQDGLVIVSVVLVMALVGLVTGGSLWLTRAELWAAGRARSHLQAAYTAEAGVRHGLALVAPDVDWSALVDRDPAALVAPEAPGPWPIGGGGWVAFPGPPFGYGLDIVAPPAGEPAVGTLVVRSAATAVRGAETVVVATVARDSRSYLPAALVLTDGGLEVDAAAIGTETAPRVELLGEDEAAPLGTPTAPELATVLDQAETWGVALAGEPISGVRRFDVDRFARRSDFDEISVDALAVEQGTRSKPVGLRLRGGSGLQMRGVGVVFVSGDLEVLGDVAWEGVIVVDGRLRIGHGACRVEGLVWSRGVSFAGPCVVAASRAAVDRADGALRLPRLPVLTGLTAG